MIINPRSRPQLRPLCALVSIKSQNCFLEIAASRLANPFAPTHIAPNVVNHNNETVVVAAAAVVAPAAVLDLGPPQWLIPLRKWRIGIARK